MQNKPLKIGITGGIGAGKSMVCEVFKVLGISVYNADDRAKALMANDKEVMDSIRFFFGNEAYLPDGTPNKSFLASQVFGDEKKLSKINSIVHPAVAKDFEQWAKAQNEKLYLIKEAALLVENGSYESLDGLITVTAPEKLRIARTLERDAHRTEADVRGIISKQLSEAEKVAKSDFVIVNDNHSLVIPQVLKIHERLIKQAQTGVV